MPGVVRQVASKCGLLDGPEPIELRPWIIESEYDAEDLIDLLVDPNRIRPVFVLSTPNFSADEIEPLLDPLPLVRATIGIADVVVLPARFTWTLSDRVGKQLSVFGGAIRAYLPGFSEDADPYKGHELILSDWFTNGSNATKVYGRLQQIAATESLRQLRLGRDVLSFAAIRQQSLDLARHHLGQAGATDQEQLRVAESQIAALKLDLQRAEEESAWLLDEQKEAEERAKASEAQLTAATFRIQRLLQQIKSGGGSADKGIQLPREWKDFADWCDQNLAGRVILTPRARREIKDPLFRNVSTAARCLLWLANEYLDRRLGGGDGDLRTSVGDGIKNERCGADSFIVSWRERRFDVEWHIKNGGNTRDPSRCLRIYYFWDDASQSVVIASMPAHRTTGAT